MEEVVVSRHRWEKADERRREDESGGWTKVGKGLEGIRSAQSDLVRSVRLRLSVHGEVGTSAVSVFPGVVSEFVKRQRQKRRRHLRAQPLWSLHYWLAASPPSPSAIWS